MDVHEHFSKRRCFAKSIPNVGLYSFSKSLWKPISEKIVTQSGLGCKNFECLSNVKDKFFTPYNFISLATCTTLTLLWIFGKSLLKHKRTHFYNKKALNPMVQAHSTSSQFLLMIQAHESHWGKFESRGLKGQEVCLVKLQWFKVDKKKKHVAWYVFPNSLNSDGSVCNR